jgi:hypothetical protein
MVACLYLNGYPGVGKLTISRELLSVTSIPVLNMTDEDPRKLIPNSRVFHNHLIIDPAGALFERDDPEYQPLRRALVSRTDAKSNRLTLVPSA